MDRLKAAEANYKSYTPINGVVEPDFLEYLKETFRKWQQYHEEGVTLGSREIAKLSNVVEGARINSRFGFEKFANRFTDIPDIPVLGLRNWQSVSRMKRGKSGSPC